MASALALSPGQVVVNQTTQQGFFSKLASPFNKFLNGILSGIPDAVKAPIGIVCEFVLAIPLGMATWAAMANNPKTKDSAKLGGIAVGTIISTIGTILTIDSLTKSPEHFRHEWLGEAMSKIAPKQSEKFFQFIESGVKNSGEAPTNHGSQANNLAGTTAFSDLKRS